VQVTIAISTSRDVHRAPVSATALRAAGGCPFNRAFRVRDVACLYTLDSPPAIELSGARHARLCQSRTPGGLRMTEWNASGYNHISALQKWLADKSLGAVDLAGSERVLDLGCGDGKITAEIAERLPTGSVAGIDPSRDMIDFAREHFVAEHANLTFDVGDATRLSYRDAFDLVVSFNALHWVSDQTVALRGIRDALRVGGRALLQLVPQGERTCLEDVIEETALSPRWSGRFADYRRPYLHLPPDEYGQLAESVGLRVDRVDVVLEAWDFGSRDAFAEFGTVTFVEWTRRIPDADKAAFIGDVLDRYRRVGDASAADAAVFHFYQMRIALRRA
jgi:trans-aconitate methyltransferase